MSILVIGLSHKTAPLAIREQLAVVSHSGQDVAERFERYSALQEKVLLSTCNRIEVYTRVEDVRRGREQIIQFLSDACGLSAQRFQRYLYSFTEGEAIQHLFRVASSLDSMMLGEPQILGQVKQAYNQARASGMVGYILGPLFEKSFRVAKKVRTETRITEHAISVSFAAVELAKKIFGDLHERTAMLIGTGKMAELAALHLRRQGIRTLLLCNRTFERAFTFSEQLGGEAIPYDHLFAHLETIDIVISSTAAPHPLLTKAAMQEVIRCRRHRPILLIDIAVPRDIDPAVHELNNTYLYDIDDLRNVVQTNIRERQQDALVAEELIRREVKAFQDWLARLSVVPTITSLRHKAEALRHQEVSKLLHKLKSVSEKERTAIQVFSTALVNKLLHAPIVNLKKEVASPAGQTLVWAVNDLFELEERGLRTLPIGEQEIVDDIYRERVWEGDEIGDGGGVSPVGDYGEREGDTVASTVSLEHVPTTPWAWP